jgi:predicted nucleic acid-binding protein
MMQAVLFDTSVYITALRTKDAPAFTLSGLAAGAVTWLSSVVLEELYAGANPRGRPEVEKLERDFERARRILVPNLTDWTQTGRVLSLMSAKYGFERVGQGRLTNDTLIALSAGRAGITVITASARDFRRLAEFRPFDWRTVNPSAGWNA